MFFGKRFSGYHGGHLSGLDILVLSIIKNTENITGYDIIQEINKNFKGLWSASAGTIYPLLNRLSGKRTVSIEEITENNRKKKIYTITETGIEELKDVLENKLQPSIDTLGGFILTTLQKIPETNETFTTNSYDIKIVHMIGKRIARVMLKRVEEPKEKEVADEAEEDQQ